MTFGFPNPKKNSFRGNTVFSFIYRLDSKRSSKSGQDYFLVEATGDMLENKPILKSDENDVGERSCDIINGLTSKHEYFRGHSAILFINL